MAHAVLTELQRQVEAATAQLKALQRSDRNAARSAVTVTASSLHAAASLLKLLLRLGASLPLSCAESMLPLASCIRLLGPRLRPAAVDGAVRVCCEAMAQPRAEWQVRRAAAETLAELAIALRQPQAQVLPTSGAAAVGHHDERRTGQAALEGSVPRICEAVLRHLKYDRVPQVRAAAAALLQVRHIGGRSPSAVPPPVPPHHMSATSSPYRPSEAAPTLHRTHQVCVPLAVLHPDPGASGRSNWRLRSLALLRAGMRLWLCLLPSAAKGCQARRMALQLKVATMRSSPPSDCHSREDGSCSLPPHSRAAATATKQRQKLPQRRRDCIGEKACRLP